MTVVNLSKLALISIFFFVTTGGFDIPDEMQRYQMVSGKIGAVVIDMQPLYLYPIADKEKAKEIPYIQETLDFCYENNIPIFAIETMGAGDTVDCLKDRLDRYGACYVEKSVNSGFENTTLEDELKRNGINTILLMGINASICVKSTARDALDRGFEICTSCELIAEPKVWPRGFKTYESWEWFDEHGVYCGRYEDLLYVLSNCLDYNKVFTPQLISKLPI